MLLRHLHRATKRDMHRLRPKRRLWLVPPGISQGGNRLSVLWFIGGLYEDSGGGGCGHLVIVFLS